MRSLMCVFLSALMASACAPTTYRHSGGTDSDGCHTNSRTGDYHCHNSGGAAGGSSGDGLSDEAIIAISIGTAVADSALVWGLMAISNRRKRYGVVEDQGGAETEESTNELPDRSLEEGKLCYRSSSCADGLTCHRGECTPESEVHGGD